MSDDIYKEIILENYEHPKNFGRIENPDYKAHEVNVNCGDEITVFIKENSGIVEDIKFDGVGCAISMASASIFTENVKGKKLSDLKKMDEKTITRLLGIDLSISRIKCATLILTAVKNSINRI